MHHPTDRIAHTMAFVTPVMEHWLEREIAQLVHPMKDRSDDPLHHERMLLPLSYILLQSELCFFIMDIVLSFKLCTTLLKYKFDVYRFYLLNCIQHFLNTSLMITDLLNCIQLY